MASGDPKIMLQDVGVSVVQSIRIPFTFADNGKTLRSPVGIPGGAALVRPITGVQINQAFNAGSGNVIDLGFAGRVDAVADDPDFYATDLAAGSVAFVPVDEVVTMLVPCDLYPSVTVQLSGTAATTGQGEAVFHYVARADTPIVV